MGSHHNIHRVSDTRNHARIPHWPQTSVRLNSSLEYSNLCRAVLHTYSRISPCTRFFLGLLVSFSLQLLQHQCQTSLYLAFLWFELNLTFKRRTPDTYWQSLRPCITGSTGFSWFTLKNILTCNLRKTNIRENFNSGTQRWSTFGTGGWESSFNYPNNVHKAMGSSTMKSPKWVNKSRALPKLHKLKACQLCLTFAPGIPGIPSRPSTPGKPLKENVGDISPKHSAI